jgi:hypothetical protein
MLVFVAPHPDDKWRASGLHPWTDFRGQISMYYRLGSLTAPIPETPFVAAEGGELALYAHGNVGFAEGKIRAKILTALSEEQQRAEAWARLALPFGEFQKKFWGALSTRDYAGAERLAQAAVAKPELETLKDRATAFAAVAQRLNRFWTKGFPDALAQLKGKEISVQGEKGVLTEIKDGNLELEKKIGDSGVAGLEIPISKLTSEEIAALLTLAKSDDKETLLDLAWLYFAEGKSERAAEQLNAAEKSGANAKAARDLMTTFFNPPRAGEN